MLHAVAQLSEHAVGNIQRVLGDEVHAHALGAHQAHDQLDALDQHLGRIVEQQVGLVKEKHELGLLGVADFRQLLEQFGQKPEQKGRVQARSIHQLVGRQHVDHAHAVGIGLHQIVDIEHGLAKELVAALAFNGQQAALYGSYAGRADVAVLGGELLGVVPHKVQHGAQVLEVQQQHAVVVGNLEHQIEHAHLGLVQIQHAADEQRAHVRDGGAHGVALLAEHIPQRCRAGQGLGQRQAALLERGGQLAFDLAGLADAAQVSLDVGHEDRHADLREAFGQFLQRDGLAGTGGAGDQAMPIGQSGQQDTFCGRVLGNQKG